MDERALLHAVALIRDIEQALEHYAKTTTDLAERDQALNGFRRARPLRQSLETWLSVRLLRSDLASRGVMESVK